MIGLPWETDDDVEAIADLCLQGAGDGARDVLGGAASRLQLNVSVNNFIPKPFTPFQWAAMADRETLRRRQELLRARLRKPGIKHSPHPSRTRATWRPLSPGAETRRGPSSRRRGGVGLVSIRGPSSSRLPPGRRPSGRRARRPRSWPRPPCSRHGLALGRDRRGTRPRLPVDGVGEGVCGAS